jgi:phosphatidylglycerol:prolipoprotein diacylglycerol transferase
LYNLVFISFFSGVIGARLVYIITYPEAFSANLWSIVSINPGLFDPIGGLLIASLVGIIFIYRKKLPLWFVLDDLTPLFAVLGIAQGTAHLAAGSAFGAPTNYPWRIFLWGEFRHPSQIYETMLAMIILIVTLMFDRSNLNKPAGTLFLIFTTLTAASRLFLEAFRGDSLIIGDGFRLTQIISWLILAVCLFLLGKKYKSVKDDDIITT